MVANALEQIFQNIIQFSFLIYIQLNWFKQLYILKSLDTQILGKYKAHFLKSIIA